MRKSIGKSKNRSMGKASIYSKEIPRMMKAFHRSTEDISPGYGGRIYSIWIKFSEIIMAIPTLGCGEIFTLKYGE